MSQPARVLIDRRGGADCSAPASVARLAILLVGDRTHFGQIESISAAFLHVRLYEDIPEGARVSLRTGNSPAMTGKVTSWKNGVAQIALDQPLDADAVRNMNDHMGTK